MSVLSFLVAFILEVTVTVAVTLLQFIKNELVA